MAVVTTVHPWGDPRVFERGIERMLDLGLEVHLFMPEPAERATRPWDHPGDFHLHTLGPRGNRFWRLAQSALAWGPVLARGPFQGIWFHDPELIPAMALCKFIYPRAHFVFDIHEELPLEIHSKDYLPAWIRGPLSGLATFGWWVAGRVFDSFAPATPPIATWFPAPRTRTVRNFPKADFLGRTEIPPAAPDPMRVVFTGALRRDRGIFEALDAISALRAEGMDLRLELYGPLHEPELSARISEAVAQGWCAHAPWLPMDELAKAIRGAGIGLFTYQDRPNYQEAIPTKVLEYMASGIPVVGSDFPATRAILGSAGCGELYPPGNMGALKAAIRRMASDGEGLARMAQAGRTAYLRHFRWEAEQRQLDWHLDQMPDS